MGSQPQGAPGQQGQGFMGGQSQAGASLQDRLEALGNNTRLLIKDPNGQGSLIVTAPTFQQTVQRKNKETVVRDLEVMQDLFNQVPEAGDGVAGRWEGFKMEVQAKGGYRPELETYNSFKMSMLGRIAGSIGGESGSRLSDQDAARMYGLFPAAWNTPRERLLKWAVFKRAVNSISASYGGANPMYLQMTPEETAALTGLKKGTLDKLVKEYNYGPMPTGTRTGKYKNIDTSFADTYLPQAMKQPADQAQVNPQEDADLMQEYQQQYGSEE